MSLPLRDALPAVFGYLCKQKSNASLRANIIQRNGIPSSAKQAAQVWNIVHGCSWSLLSLKYAHQKVRSYGVARRKEKQLGQIHMAHAVNKKCSAFCMGLNSLWYALKAGITFGLEKNLYGVWKVKRFCLRSKAFLFLLWPLSMPRRQVLTLPISQRRMRSSLPAVIKFFADKKAVLFQIQAYVAIVLRPALVWRCTTGLSCSATPELVFSEGRHVLLMS